MYLRNEGGSVIGSKVGRRFEGEEAGLVSNPRRMKIGKKLLGETDDRYKLKTAISLSGNGGFWWIQADNAWL